MGSTVTFLLSIGLGLDWATWAKTDTFPRPTLWAVPSPVIPQGADVTLRCQGRLGSDRIQLWVDGELKEERNASWEPTEFILQNVSALRDARSYCCRSRQKSLWSELSDPLNLVVMTGDLPKPSIGVKPDSPVLKGRTVTIWCQVSSQDPSQDYNFTLLEAKSLEPLWTQNPGGTRADFSLLSVSPEDSGSYSCIYYRKAFPHTGSHPSQALELTVSGKFPKPTLGVQPGLMMPQGSNITLWCSRPKLSALGEVTFILWKVGTQESLQHQTSTDLWTSFLLPSVRPEDTGNYSCNYWERIHSFRGSEPSDVLELVVLGSLPRPFLSALPGLIVEPGTHVTLQCRRPPPTFPSAVTFSLLKDGTPLPLYKQNSVGTSADFALFSVRAQDVGNYSCAYYVKMAPYQLSESSDVLEIWVTDALSKPSLSAWPVSEVTSGANVTLVCQGPSWATGFLLFKEGNEKILLSMRTSEDGTQFFLTHVTPNHSGNYICSYQLSLNGRSWSLNSDPLQLIVRGSMPCNILIITLSCISFFFLLCILLRIFLCQESIPPWCLQGDSPRRSHCCLCLTQFPEAPIEEALHTEVEKKRSRPPSIAVAEDPQGVTYTQLNIATLNKRKIDPKKTPKNPSPMPLCP